MVGRGGNSRNWLSPLFMLIHYSIAKYDNIGRKQKGEECPRWVNKEIPELFDYYCDGVSTMELAEMFNTNKSMINKIIRYKFKELWQGRK
mgnify:CR=1 FL=1